MIYLDNAASTRPYDEVIDYYTNCLSDCYANPSALHEYGNEAMKPVLYAKEEILKVLNIKDDRRVVFTSGATESSNLAIRGTLEKFDDIKRCRIITTTVEHPSVSNVFKYYSKRGCECVYVPVDKFGRLDTDRLFSSINCDTKLISVIWVNNEVGSINDIAYIAKKAKEIKKDVIVHVDAVQGFGKVVADFSNIDLITISGHKFHAPKGIGALICKKNIVLIEQMLGGGQQDGYRSGTINSPSIGAMGKACEIINSRMKDSNLFLKKLQEYLYKKLSSLFGEDNINTRIFDSNYCSHILSISFPGIKSEVLLHMLENDGIYVSTSSACSSHSKHKSVLMAYGLDQTAAQGTVRISMSEFNTFGEIDIFCDKLVEYVQLLYTMKGTK